MSEYRKATAPSPLYHIISCDDDPPMVWLNKGAFESRWDAHYYQPRFVVMLSVLDRFKTISGQASGEVKPIRRIAERIRCGPFGSSILAETYVEDGVLLARPINLNAGVFDDSDVVYVSPQAAKQMITFDSRTVLFARVGNVNAAILPDIYGEVAISPNIIAVQVAEKYNHYYVGAFAACKYGLSQLERGLKTVAQPTISTAQVKDMLIPLPPRPIQDYIGNKVKRAEELRAEANRLQQRAEALVNEALGISEFLLRLQDKQREDWWWVEGKQTRTRWDPDFHSPLYTELEEFIASLPGAKELARVATFPERKINPRLLPERHFSYIEIGAVNRSTGMIEKVRCFSGENAPSRARQYVRPDDVLVAMVKESIEIHALIDDSHDGALATTGFAIVRPRQGSIATSPYLFAVLNSPWFVRLKTRYLTGTVMQSLSKVDIGGIPIPVVNVREVSERITTCFENRHQAKRLLAEAKEDVERLVLGELDWGM